MAKLDKNRLILGVLLIILIAITDLIMDHAKLPTWPAFMVMIFFFEAHMDKKKAANIIVGGLFGMVNLIIIKAFLGAVGPSIGMEYAKILYVVIFVYAIVALGEIIPILFNNYAFMFFLITALAATTPNFNLFVSMGVEVVLGGIFILAILGMVKIVTMLAMRSAAKAANK